MPSNRHDASRLHPERMAARFCKRDLGRGRTRRPRAICRCSALKLGPSGPRCASSLIVRSDMGLGLVHPRSARVWTRLGVAGQARAWLALPMHATSSFVSGSAAGHAAPRRHRCGRSIRTAEASSCSRRDHMLLHRDDEHRCSGSTAHQWCLYVDQSPMRSEVRLSGRQRRALTPSSSACGATTTTTGVETGLLSGTSQVVRRRTLGRS